MTSIFLFRFLASPDWRARRKHQAAKASSHRILIPWQHHMAMVQGQRDPGKNCLAWGQGAGGWLPGGCFCRHLHCWVLNSCKELFQAPASAHIRGRRAMRQADPRAQHSRWKQVDVLAKLADEHARRRRGGGGQGHDIQADLQRLHWGQLVSMRISTRCISDLRF